MKYIAILKMGEYITIDLFEMNVERDEILNLQDALEVEIKYGIFNEKWWKNV